MLHQRGVLLRVQRAMNCGPIGFKIRRGLYPPQLKIRGELVRRLVRRRFCKKNVRFRAPSIIDNKIGIHANIWMHSISSIK